MKKINNMKHVNYHCNREDKHKKHDNRGMGTVEMILIIVVLVGLVLIFKNQIQELADTIFSKIAVDSFVILS